MLKTRVIPVLYLMNGLIVRSEGFQQFKAIGNPITQLERLNDWLADELVYIDITREGDYDLRRDDFFAVLPGLHDNGRGVDLVVDRQVDHHDLGVAVFGLLKEILGDGLGLLLEGGRLGRAQDGAKFGAKFFLHRHTRLLRTH